MKTLICIPCMDTIDTVFFESFLNLEKPDCDIKLTRATLIYDARNKLAQSALWDGYDRIAWFDSDMVFAPDTLTRLMARLDEGAEFVTGLYFTRKPPMRPVIYTDIGARTDENGVTIPYANNYNDYPRDSYFEVAGAGFGGCVMTTELLTKIAKFGLPFSPIHGFGEDLSFCLKVSQIGVKMYCDSTIKLGHMAHVEIGEGNYTNEKPTRN